MLSVFQGNKQVVCPLLKSRSDEMTVVIFFGLQASLKMLDVCETRRLSKPF